MSQETFFYNNLVRATATTLTLTSEDSSYPATNLKDHRTTKKARSTVNSLTLVIDLGSALDVDSFLFQGDLVNKSIGVSGAITIEANSSDSWGAPAFSTSCTPSSEYYYGIKTFATQTYRYWRLTATGTGSYAELSNIFLGEKLNLANMSIDFGWSATYKDLSKKNSNRYGQVFIDERNVVKSISAAYKFLNKDELTSVQDMFNLNSVTEPIWFYVFDPETTTVVNDAEEFMLHGFLNQKPTITNGSFGLFDLSFKLDEIV